MRRGCTVAALAAVLCWTSSAAAQSFRERDLVVGPPATAAKVESAAQPVKFARIAFQLPPTNWARIAVEQIGPLEIVTGASKMLTWGDDQIDFTTPKAKSLFDAVAGEAGLKTDAASSSLFSNESDIDLLVGARVVAMKGAFCNNCQILKNANRWNGRVTMGVAWEVYSGRERRVLATIRTDGGFIAPSMGLVGDPELLIYEAFKDNARRLTADEGFRQVLMGGAASVTAAAGPKAEPISFRAAPAKPRAISATVSSVATVFANEGHGSGFLISQDGHVLTNQHVVGASKYVKLRWSDGSEAVGEVLRVDRRRDVALIKVAAGTRAPLAYRSGGDVGQAVFAIGAPLDGALQATVTKGIVSAKRTFEGLDYIQSDVAISGGNSGGPLLAEDGTVIGLTVAGFMPAGSQVGLNLFIPIQPALDALGLTPAAASATSPR